MIASIIEGVSEIADFYDAMILDLWGLIHNGVALYPGVDECLNNLREKDMRIILLSNAPRPSEIVRERLRELGLRDDDYERLITSGDLTRDALVCRYDDWHKALGVRCFHIGPQRDKSLLAGLKLEIVERLDTSEFVLNTGLFNDELECMEDYLEPLAQALKYNLPMVCANPDLEVMRGEKTVLCAGAVAKRYEDLGGEVFYHGKPFPRAYEFCFDIFTGIPKSRILAAGDSLRTDIAGANAAGIDSMLVMGGLYADAFDFKEKRSTIETLDKMIVDSGNTPTSAIASFKW